MDSSFKSSQRLDLPPHTPDSPVQRLAADTQQNHSKYSSFLVKGAIVAIAILLLPFYPSQPPEFTNHTIFKRGWEFLRLGLIGVAVSYGLMSRRRAETDKENQAQIDSTQNYVSKILQVAPVFDSEIDSSPYSDTGKVQKWSSLYFPSESVVMVAADEDGDRQDKPLSLPVRSLKSGRPDSVTIASVRKVPDVSGKGPVAVSSHARNSDSIRNGKREIGVSDLSNLDGNAKENVVLPSPIPWRSRSGRFEVKEDVGLPPMGPMPTSVSESELQRFETPTFRSPIPWSSRPTSSSTLSPSSSPSHSVSPTPRPASVQNSAPAFISSVRNGASASANEFVPETKSTPRNLKHSDSFESSPSGKSVRTVRKSESLNSNSSHDSGVADERRERRSRRGSEPRTDESSSRNNRSDEFVMVNKPVIHNKGLKNEAEETVSRKNRKTDPPFAVKAEKKSREAEVMMVEKNPRKSSFEAPPPPPIELYEEYQRNWKKAKEKIDEFKAQVEEPTDIDDDDDDEEEEEEHVQEGKNDSHKCTETEAVGPKPVVETQIDANEVDKKADEFIAKFREQIRLQRIESIKRASGQKKKTRSNSAT